MSFPKKPKKIKQVYLDHAATTAVDSRVMKAMRPYFAKDFANPSALYQPAVTVRIAVEKARKQVSEILCTQPDTIIFTGSGTESTNLAIFGVTKNKPPGHIITTPIEHHAVLNPIKQLEKQGWEVTYLNVDSVGQITIEECKKALRKETVLVSLMYANNEIGTLLPIADIGREILKWRKRNNSAYPYFHTDACQAAQYLDLHTERLHVDLMSMNGSKIYGPKGIGVLYKRRGVDIQPMLYGGGQEMGLRSGTENVPGIIGFAKALQSIEKEKVKEAKRVRKLRDYFWKRLQKKIPQITINGPEIDDANERLPNNLNITFPGVDAEALILYLSEYGITVSSGSACSADTEEVSHVLLACGVTAEKAKQSIRFTLGKETSKADIEYVLTYLPNIIQELLLMNRV